MAFIGSSRLERRLSKYLYGYEVKVTSLSCRELNGMGVMISYSSIKERKTCCSTCPKRYLF